MAAAASDNERAQKTSSSSPSGPLGAKKASLLIQQISKDLWRRHTSLAVFAGKEWWWESL